MEVGAPSQKILDLSEELAVDLIVLGVKPPAIFPRNVNASNHGHSFRGRERSELSRDHPPTSSVTGSRPAYENGFTKRVIPERVKVIQGIPNP